MKDKIEEIREKVVVLRENLIKAHDTYNTEWANGIATEIVELERRIEQCTDILNDDPDRAIRLKATSIAKNIGGDADKIFAMIVEMDAQKELLEQWNGSGAIPLTKHQQDMVKNRMKDVISDEQIESILRVTCSQDIEPVEVALWWGRDRPAHGTTAELGKKIRKILKPTGDN